MKVSVCNGRGCKGKFSEYITERIKNDIEFYKSGDNIILDTFECTGDCQNGPNIMIDKTIYPYMNPAKASELIFKNIKNNNKNNKITNNNK